MTIVERELQKVKFEIDYFLGSFFKEKLKEYPKLAFLMEQIKSLIFRGGDRLRPALCLWAYAGCRGKNKKIVTMAACLELFHTFALIHDDIMDNSSLRRGAPTVYISAGVSNAVLAGDLAVFLGDILAERFINPRARVYYLQMKQDVILGQYLDITNDLFSENLNDKDILKTYYYKTALYSTVFPLLIGASLADAGLRIIEGLSEYGKNIGVAFQIYDDILGILGDDDKVGKKGIDDLQERKATLLIFYTLNSANRVEKTTLKKIVGRKDIVQKEFLWIKNLMLKYKADKYCLKKAEKMINRAKEVLADLDLKKREKRILLKLADFMILRRD